MTKTLAQFVLDHQGRYLDFDGQYGPQCVDLVQFYLRECLNDPPLPGNAVAEFGERPDLLNWQRNVWGNPLSKPPAGAIVVWHQDHYVGTGIYGHTAVCTNPGDGNTFHSFDQNWPPGSPCHIQAHSFEGVTGWGIPRSKPPPPIPAPPPGPGDGAVQEGQAWWQDLLDWLAKLFGLR